MNIHSYEHVSIPPALSSFQSYIPIFRFIDWLSKILRSLCCSMGEQWFSIILESHTSEKPMNWHDISPKKNSQVLRILGVQWSPEIPQWTSG